MQYDQLYTLDWSWLKNPDFLIGYHIHKCHDIPSESSLLKTEILSFSFRRTFAIEWKTSIFFEISALFFPRFSNGDINEHLSKLPCYT